MPVLRRLHALSATLLLLFSVVDARADSPLEIVQGLSEAFNDHNVEAMARWLDNDVQWMSLNGSELAIEADGRAALITGMKDYFASLPSARSHIEQSMVTGRYVTVLERASWIGRDGEARSQSALAVYEIRDAKVLRVWYYPAQR